MVRSPKGLKACGFEGLKGWKRHPACASLVCHKRDEKRICTRHMFTTCRSGIGHLRAARGAASGLRLLYVDLRSLQARAGMGPAVKGSVAREFRWATSCVAVGAGANCWHALPHWTADHELLSVYSKL